LRPDGFPKPGARWRPFFRAPPGWRGDAPWSAAIRLRN